MLLQKPEKIYHEVVEVPQVPEVPAVVDPVTVDVDSFVDQLSSEDLIKLHKRLLDRLYTTVGTTTPAILQEPIPEYKPVEPVESAKPVEEPTQLPVLAHWGKPEGWDKPSRRTFFLKVLWRGMLDKDMDVDDYKRYDKFVSWFKPTVIIIVLTTCILIGYKLYTASNTGNSTPTRSFIDRSIQWVVDTYDSWTSDPEPENDGFKTMPMSIDTQKLIMNTFSQPKDSTFIRDTTIAVPLVDSSLILK